MENVETAVTKNHQDRIGFGFLGLLVRGFIGLVDTTKEAARRNIRMMKASWRGAFRFVLSRNTWLAKVCWAPVLMIGCLAWTLVLIMLTFAAPFFFPVGVIVVVSLIFIVIDQATYPNNEVDSVFTNVENASLTVDQKGALLFRASYTQLDNELNSFFLLGWCPNDLRVYPGRWLDNRCNRQRGVQYASVRAVRILSERLTKLGMGDQEDPDTKNAHLHLANFPDQWGAMGAFQDASENHYTEAVKLLENFVARANNSDSTTSQGQLINLRTDDFVEIMRMLVADGGILTEPYGGLTSRNEKVSYVELDDRVYYAQGAAIVARDMLVAMRYMYKEELSRGGGLDNLDAAIDALNAAAQYNPPWISRGDSRFWWSTKFADDRAKMQSYFTEAFRRIENLKESLRN